MPPTDYDENSLIGTYSGIGSSLRVWPSAIQPRTLKRGTGTIPLLHPLHFEQSSQRWVIWDASIATNEQSRITAAATAASDGTFTLTVQGITTAPLAHDISASALETALTAAGLGDGDGEDFEAVVGGGGLGSNNGTMTITWSGQWTGRDMQVSGTFTDLTGNIHAVSELIKGSLRQIDGFLWPDEATLVSNKEVLTQVLLGGRIHFDDIPTPADDSNRGSLIAALSTGHVRRSGFIIEGLARFH